jgi:hypothetical protein
MSEAVKKTAKDAKKATMKAADDAVGNSDIQQILGFRQTANSDELPKWRIQIQVKHLSRYCALTVTPYLGLNSRH